MGKKRNGKKKSKLRENLEAVGLAFLIVFCLKVFVVENYVVPTGSMIPTISIGNRLLALKFFYGAKIPFTGARLPGVRDPERGDIVVFLAPDYEPPGLFTEIVNPVVYTLSLGFITIDKQPKYFVKRCIGVEGDTIEIRAKEVFINGRRGEVWWPERHTDPTIIPPGDSFLNRRDYLGPVIVPEGCCFMMGDNRDESYDSRFWGFVTREKIFGRAFFRIWPPAGIGPLK